MSHNNHPNLNLRTTSQIIRQATSTYFSSTSAFFTFIYISLFLISFRTIVGSGSHFVASAIYRHTTFEALLSRLDHSIKNIDSEVAALDRRRHRPVLQLRRIGALDDDFFSGNEERDRSLFRFDEKKVEINGSRNYSLRISNFVDDSGVRVSEVARWGLISFKVDDDSPSRDEVDDDNSGVALPFFLKGLGFDDMGALLFLVTIFFSTYVSVIMWFVAIYSSVLGMVFLTVINDLLGRCNGSSWASNILDGSHLGLKKLWRLIMLRWMLRDALTQVLGIWFFGDLLELYTMFGLWGRLKLMTFSVMLPSSWEAMAGSENEIAGFLVALLVADSFLGLVFAVDSWVAIVGPGLRPRGEIVNEGCYLICTMMKQAMQMKVWEALLCGSLMRMAMEKVCGGLATVVFQAVVEVYFMVAWLIFYFAARYKDASGDGREFGLRDLEGFAEELDR